MRPLVQHATLPAWAGAPGAPHETTTMRQISPRPTSDWMRNLHILTSGGSQCAPAPPYHSNRWNVERYGSHDIAMGDVAVWGGALAMEEAMEAIAPLLLYSSSRSRSLIRSSSLSKSQ